MGRIASIAIATPPQAMDQTRVEAFLSQHYANRLSPRSRAVMKKVFAHPSIARRFFALGDVESLVTEDPDSRIERFTRWAVELSKETIVSALAQVGLTVDAVVGLVVNTCTGYLCPGISTYLIEELGACRNIRAYDLVGSGCGGAVPNLQISDGLLRHTNTGVVVSASVEICSATFQMDDDIGLIVSNALFGDGAAAAILWNRPQGLALIDSASRYAPKHRHVLRYIYKKGQLYNQLSVALPQLVCKTVAEVVTDLLKPLGLHIADIHHWALHPGGEKVINAIKGNLGLSEAQVRMTREILARYGNMSSPTVWFVLREILNNEIAPNEWCMMVAFGAGLSAHAFLLQAPPTIHCA